MQTAWTITFFKLILTFMFYITCLFFFNYGTSLLFFINYCWIDCLSILKVDWLFVNNKLNDCLSILSCLNVCVFTFVSGVMFSEWDPCSLVPVLSPKCHQWTLKSPYLGHLPNHDHLLQCHYILLLMMGTVTTMIIMIKMMLMMMMLMMMITHVVPSCD